LHGVKDILGLKGCTLLTLFIHRQLWKNSDSNQQRLPLACTALSTVTAMLKGLLPTERAQRHGQALSVCRRDAGLGRGKGAAAQQPFGNPTLSHSHCKEA